MPTPLIIDLSHHNTVKSFDDVKDAGIVGVIHKATEGSTYADDMYASRKKSALQSGLLWASYHFLKHGNVSSQMDWYLKNVAPVHGERVVIDFEDAACTLEDLEDAVIGLNGADLNLQVTVYSGHLIEQLLGDTHHELLSTTSLWTAEYDPPISWPDVTWPVWTLWQYTDKGTLPGISGACDLNQFNGSRANCIKWMQPADSAPQPQPDEKVVRVYSPPGVRVEVIEIEKE